MLKKYFLTGVEMWLVVLYVYTVSVGRNDSTFLTDVTCQFTAGELAKLRKAIINFVMSVRPHGTARLPLDGFS
jgi:hypothetical protein